MKPYKGDKKEERGEMLWEQALGKKSEKKKEEKLESLGQKERIEILKKFTKAALEKYGNVIRSIVLFGSTARKQYKGESDIDVFVILDDTKVNMTPELKEDIEWGLEDIAKPLSKQLSVQQPYLLTEFWALVREGHPIVFNFIREGLPIYDRDIFMPIKLLLQRGEIRPSKEAVEKFIERGPKRIRRVENAKIYMVVEDCYYAMLESAQAVLMFLGMSPPRPTDAPKEMRKALVEKKMLAEKYVGYLDGVITVRKGVEHKTVKDISGEELDSWISKTKEFVKEMQKLIVRIELIKRESMVLKSEAIMKETVFTLLKSMKKRLPAKDEELEESFRKHLVQPGIVHESYLDVFSKLKEMKAKVEKGKVKDIPKEDILVHREYVRKFIREASRCLKNEKRAEKSAKGKIGK